MKLKFLKIEDFIRKYLGNIPPDEKDTSCSVYHLKEGFAIYAVKLDFHLVILGVKGNSRLTVGYHDFTLEASSISIVPPHTVFSVKKFSPNFEAFFLLFKSDFVKKGFVKSEIMEELLFINPDYPPIFNLEKADFKDTLYKFQKIQNEIGNQQPFCLEVSRLYVLQILYDYNRVCEICLLNSDKHINREYQVMYEFRKLVDKNFPQIKTVKEYADLMCLTSKYISECVKNQTGLSALSLIHHRILLESEFLLTYSQLSIKEIADKLGFNSVSSFSRFFKEKKGISPVHYQLKQEN